MTDRIDTASLLARVNLVDVIHARVPLRKSGAEYEACCPFHTEDSPSFKVNPAKNFYHCFGCGAHGDAIRFVQEFDRVPFVEACRLLGADVAPVSAAPARLRKDKPKPDAGWVPVLPVPEGALPAPRSHSHRGEPEAAWAYRAADGQLLGHVYRFRTSEGGKEVLPLTWCRHSGSGESMWRFMAFPAPRPLYGLWRLAARLNDPVLLVEGEKCASAGRNAVRDFVTVSWPGGGKAVDKVDWPPLAGRRVVLWPDSDAKREPLAKAEKASGVSQDSKPFLPVERQPGYVAMARIADVLLDLGCQVEMIPPRLPGSCPDGWDLADLVAEGNDPAAYIAAHSAPYKPPPAQAIDGGAPPPAGAGRVSSGDGDDSWRKLLLRKDDRLIDCRENVYLMLKHHPAWSGALWIDEFARKIVKRKPAPWEAPADYSDGEPWNEDDDYRLGLWLAQQERFLVRSAENLATAVGWVSREERFHPVRDYLDGLQWDGVERLKDWLTDYIGIARTPYSTLAGRLFLIGMAARIYRPGCQLRSVPIFEGEQYRGKSTALRILGGRWFGDTPLDLNNKDSYQLIQGRWLYEIAELDAFNRAEQTRIKAFISSPEDRFRAPYDRAPREWPRHTVFFGTTNQHEYFKDQTGNTRYWPLRAEAVDTVDLDGLTAARDRLFAEAVALYKQGERWHPTREEQTNLFEPEQSDREIADPWQHTIGVWLMAQSSTKVTVMEILRDCLKVEMGKVDGTRQMSTRIGIAMKRLGWIKGRENTGLREYFYSRPAGWSAR